MRDLTYAVEQADWTLVSARQERFERMHLTGPYPGSVNALREGCMCPVVENNHGETSPLADGGWWVSVRCPVHWAIHDEADVGVEPLW